MHAMDAASYIHEDSSRLKQSLSELRGLLKAAEGEIHHARGLNIDLEGPIGAADKDIRALSSEIHDIERIVQIIDAGYPYWEKSGYQEALDACGFYWTWYVLSEVYTPGTVAGCDQADVRLPIQAQKDYAEALSSHRFDRFAVCRYFEPSEGEVGEVVEDVTYDLFGVVSTPTLAGGESLFLVSQWK